MRRIRLALNTPTQDGDTEIVLLTNLGTVNKLISQFGRIMSFIRREIGKIISVGYLLTVP
jgi:hypothetical protein